MPIFPFSSNMDVKIFVNAYMFNQGITPCWKSVHRISGYQPDIRGLINGYQDKVNKISVKYLTDFSEILKDICWIYLNICQI